MDDDGRQRRASARSARRANRDAEWQGGLHHLHAAAPAMKRILFLLTVVALGACFHRVSLMNPDEAAFSRAAPDSFDVEMITTKGPLTVRVRRDWSPHDRPRQGR